MATTNTTTTTNGATTAAPKRSGPPEHAVQSGWFASNLGREVRLRLLDGSAIGGLLEAVDVYTLAIRVSGREEPVLVMKHATALVMRTEDRDQERGRSATPA
jgi:hypothetical protein